MVGRTSDQHGAEGWHATRQLSATSEHSELQQHLNEVIAAAVEEDPAAEFDLSEVGLAPGTDSSKDFNRARAAGQPGERDQLLSRVSVRTGLPLDALRTLAGIPGTWTVG